MTQPAGFEAVLVTITPNPDESHAHNEPHKLEPEPESNGAVLARLGTDGAAWAAEFVKRADDFADRGGNPLDPTPGDFLHVWFANAIEAGRTAGYWAGVRDGETGEQQSVEKFLESHKDEVDA